MNPLFRIRYASLIAILVLSLECIIHGEEFSCPLELKYLESPTQVPSEPGMDYVRMTRGQYFTMQAGDVRLQNGGLLRLAAPSSTDHVRFNDVVKTEPAKYNSKHPFRGVVQLGSGQYGFVFDCVNDQSIDYSLLYFDLNHNGDLTDDKVIEGTIPERQSQVGHSSSEFQRIDLAVDVGGTQVDYAFFFGISARTVTRQNLLNSPGARIRLQSWASDPSEKAAGNTKESAEKEKSEATQKNGQSQKKEEAKEEHQLVYVNARLIPAVYREGTITIDGKPKHLVLLDSNGNGRFDDMGSLRKYPNGRVYPQYGDLLLVDPETAPTQTNQAFNTRRGYLTSVTNIDNSFFQLAVPPAGDQITLTPIPTGFVNLPSEGFRAIIHNDETFLNIGGDSTSPVPCPAGEWKLVSYTIDLTGRWEPKKESEKQGSSKNQESSLKRLIVGSPAAVNRSVVDQPRSTRLMAYGYSETQAIKLKEGETVALPFGSPYQTIVKTDNAVEGGKTVQLQMLLIGAGGEQCGSLLVDGSRPKPPEFTIHLPDGKVIDTGRFKWG